MGRKNKSGVYSFWQKVLIIVGVILLILVVADAYFNYREKKKTDAERLQELKVLKSKHDSGIKKSIINERWIYISARSLIVLLILFLNLFFYYSYYYNLQWEKVLARLLNINEALILLYSFIAFMLYGTPSKFVKGIRQVIFRWRKRKNLPANIDIDQLNKEIAELEKKIASKDGNPPTAN